MATILEAIFKRRSIRKYIDQPVPQETLEQLLQAGMAGPSAVNSRPWEFVVVTEPAILDNLRTWLVLGRHNAPAAIVVCGSPWKAKNPAGQIFWVQDCSAATENILLAAAGLGLGSVWVGVHPIWPNVAAVRQVLRIPRTVTPLCVIFVGYPAEEKPPRTQYDAQRVHWQRYTEPKKSATDTKGD